MVKPTKSLFSKIASEYDTWYQTQKGAFIDQIETDLAFGMIELHPGMKILDIGCGTGNFSLKLGRKGCQVTGIDISEEMLEIAKLKSIQEKLSINFMQMDVNHLQFEEALFDAVFSMAAFEFIQDINNVLNQIYKTVKPGGFILIGTINYDSDWGRYYLEKSSDKDSVFHYAQFKTIHNFKKWKPEKIVSTGECLFISPTAKENQFNQKTEKQLRGKVNGGYFCVLWKK